jgi:SAM-dependent methyltransferase
MNAEKENAMFPQYVSYKNFQPLEYSDDKSTLSLDGEIFASLKNNFYRFCIDGYTEAFGQQWNAFRKTQLDSFSNTSISRDRLLGFIDSLEILQNKNVLEVGSGAGRFTEIFSLYAEHLVTLDASSAIDANYANNGYRFSNITFCQASVYELPFPDDYFDVTVALGMIQHTPDPIETLRVAVKKTKPGGLVIADFYRLRLSFLSRLGVQVARYFLRSGDSKRNFKIVKNLVDFFYPLHSIFGRNLFGYLIISRISPIVTYFHKFPQLDEQQQREWAWLDTHDTLTDHYKYLFTMRGIRKLCRQLNCNIVVLKKGGNGIELVITKNF